MYRIGIDVGGTFTDVTLLNSETGKYDTYKLSSTLQDQSVAIANGTKETLELYGVPVSEIEYFGHGTTVAVRRGRYGRELRAVCGLSRGFLGYKLLRRALKMVLKWTAQMRKRQALDKTGHSGGTCSTKTH